MCRAPLAMPRHPNAAGQLELFPAPAVQGREIKNPLAGRA